MYVDFFLVAQGHEAVHEDLENWGRWCHSRPTGSMHPMFRWAKPAQHWEAINPASPVDKIKAQRTEKLVAAMPHKPQFAIRWSYVFRTPPRKAANALGVTLEGLALLVRDGRQMILTADKKM